MEFDGLGGCAALIVGLLVIAVLVAVVLWLPGQISDAQNAEARATLARAELVDARAAAEHQRAVDADARYVLHVATLAAFTASPVAWAGLAIVLVALAMIAGWSLRGLRG